MEKMQVEVTPEGEAIAPQPVEEVVAPQPVEEVVAPQPVEEVVAPQPVEEVVAPQPVEEVVAPQPVEEVILQLPKRTKVEVTSNAVCDRYFSDYVQFPLELPGALDGQEFLLYTADQRWITAFTKDEKLFCEEPYVKMWKNKIYYFV